MTGSISIVFGPDQSTPKGMAMDHTAAGDIRYVICAAEYMGNITCNNSPDFDVALKTLIESARILHNSWQSGPKDHLMEVIACTGERVFVPIVEGALIETNPTVMTVIRTADWGDDVTVSIYARQTTGEVDPLIALATPTLIAIAASVSGAGMDKALSLIQTGIEAYRTLYVKPSNQEAQ